MNATEASIHGVALGHAGFGYASSSNARAAAAINAAVNSAATQGVLVATGLQDKFSWKEECRGLCDRRSDW